MAAFNNPFRPGAGHSPPYLAGRGAETEEFMRLLAQDTILENMVLTGLRGVGKTVLLESLKPLALERGWLWVGTDLTESASVSEAHLANRLCTDLAPITSSAIVTTEFLQGVGFTAKESIVQHTLSYDVLTSIYEQSPGLSLDKTKTVLETAWAVLSRADAPPRGIIFAYDEAQNLTDHAEKEQFPVSLLLDTFQSLQRQGLPLMLVLTGLPTLFPKLVEARTFAERMFHIIFLERLSPADSREAILQPLENMTDAIKLNDQSVDTIVNMSGGYPYFIQFICKEVYDAFLQRLDKGEQASVPVSEIEQKLDAGFFAGRWARATDRQRELMFVIAHLENSDDEFTVREIAERSREISNHPFSGSHINQMLATLSRQGLIFKNRHGKYSFAVPLLDSYIRRQQPPP